MLGVGVEGERSKGARNGNSSPGDNPGALVPRTEENKMRGGDVFLKKDPEASGGHSPLSLNSQNL